MTERTENDALIEAISGAQVPDELAPGQIYGYKFGDRVHVVDLLDRDLARPRRKTGVVQVEDAASFALYYGKHADVDSEVFVDVESGVVTAVLDAHEATDAGLDDEVTARWGEHRVVLRLKATDAWLRWKRQDRQWLRQVAFAEFVEENRVDIRQPSAADMLELAQHFSAKTRVVYNSSAVLANGNKRLVFTEETDAGAGTKGQLEVPSVLVLGIAPFGDSQPYEVTARFRYRIDGAVLFMGYLLDNADDVQRDAVKTVVAGLEEELGIKVMRGVPAPSGGH